MCIKRELPSFVGAHAIRASSTYMSTRPMISPFALRKVRAQGSVVFSRPPSFFRSLDTLWYQRRGALTRP